MSQRWVFRSAGMVVMSMMGDDVVLTIDGVGREGIEPADPDLAAALDRYAPDLTRTWGTAWTVADPAALERVLDRLAMEGFEREDASLVSFDGASVLPDLQRWHGRSWAAFLRRYGPPTAEVRVHSSTSGIRYVARRGFYGAGGTCFVVETDSYAVLTLTGPKPHPRPDQLVIGQHTVFADEGAMRVAIERWPRDL